MKKNRNGMMCEVLQPLLLAVMAVGLLFCFLIGISLIAVTLLILLISGESSFIPYMTVCLTLDIFLASMLFLVLSVISRGRIEGLGKCVIEECRKSKRSARKGLKKLSDFSVKLANFLVHVGAPILFGLLCVAIACTIFIGEIKLLLFLIFFAPFLFKSCSI